MNSLDQAFIRAFAKESPARMSPPEAVARREPMRHPEEWAESGSRQVLVLHGVCEPGRSFRLDHPAVPGGAVPDSHLSHPTVERVESYDTGDIARVPSPRVLMENHVAPLEPLCPRPVEEPCYQLWVTAEGIASEWITLNVAWLGGHDLPCETPLAPPAHTGVWREEPALFDRMITHCAGDCAALDRESSGPDGLEPVVVPPSRERVAEAVGSLPREPFQAAWEVDAFHWPAICRALDTATEGKLTQSGGELHVATRDGLKVLAVIAALRGEGTTTLALSLAWAAAQAGSRVALLDADTAHPDLARRLGLEPTCDWRGAARRRQSPTEAAIMARQDAVTLFPLVDRNEPAGDRRDEALLPDTLARLRPHFDLVIVDLSPLDLRPESDQRLGSLCGIDMAVLVRGVRTTSIDQTLSAVARLRAMGIRGVGIVENFTAVSAAGRTAGEPTEDYDTGRCVSGCDTADVLAREIRTVGPAGSRTQAA